jgi:hypothetical protein
LISITFSPSGIKRFASSPAMFSKSGSRFALSPAKPRTALALASTKGGYGSPCVPIPWSAPRPPPNCWYRLDSAKPNSSNPKGIRSRRILRSDDEKCEAIGNCNSVNPMLGPFQCNRSSGPVLPERLDDCRVSWRLGRIRSAA